MTELIIKAGGFTFGAQLEEEDAPNTCAMFRKLLPYTGQIVHVRWSGEGVWIPLGDEDFGVKYENHTSHAGPGQILLYPRRDQRDGDLFGLWRRLLCVKDGDAGRQPFYHADLGAGEPQDIGQCGAVGRGKGHFLRIGLKGAAAKIMRTHSFISAAVRICASMALAAAISANSNTDGCGE